MVRIASLLCGAIVSSFASAFPAAEAASSGSSCISYKPVGWNTTKAKINFYDNNPNDEPANGHGFHAPTLPANASAINPWALSNHNRSSGSAFAFRACNASALGLTTNSTQSSCSHGGCYITYTNYVQVVNPYTGHCLTAVDGYAVNSTKLAFKPCVTGDKQENNNKITTGMQLFETDQQVLYSPGYGYVTSYGTVSFNLIEQRPVTDHLLAWVLDRKDNRTIEVIQYMYTQDGLSANLLPA